MNAYEKMHQALLALDAWVKVIKNNPKDKTAIECAEFVEETIKAALAESPRQCDVGTAEEQRRRYDEWRNHDGLRAALGKDEFDWAQMPC